MSQLEQAIAFALEVHRGQKDKAGMPYILHPLHLMAQMETEAEMLTAVLHDVIEDSSHALEELRQKLGLSETVLAAIDLLTHRPEDSYDDYVRRLKTNPIARKVKLADLRHNASIFRFREIQEKDLLRLAKYHRAWLILTEDE